MANVADFNKKFDLFWFGFGDLEGGHANGKALHGTLQAAGVNHVPRVGWPGLCCREAGP